MSLSSLVSPGSYAAFANNYVRFGGYLGRTGPPPDYVGGGVALAAVAAMVLGRRRALTWLLVLLAVVSVWLSLGARLVGGPEWLSHVWLPWAQLSRLPVLKEILPDQFAPFIALFGRCLSRSASTPSWVLIAAATPGLRCTGVASARA